MSCKDDERFSDPVQLLIHHCERPLHVVDREGVARSLLMNSSKQHEDAAEMDEAQLVERMEFIKLAWADRLALTWLRGGSQYGRTGTSLHWRVSRPLLGRLCTR